MRPRIYLSAYFLLLFTVFLTPAQGHASYWINVLRPESKQDRIPQLELKDTRFQITTISQGRFGIYLEGEFTLPDWSLVIDSQSSIHASPQFAVEIPLKPQESQGIEIMAIGPLGETKKETWVLEIKDEKALDLLLHRKSPLSFSAALGVTSLSYQQVKFDETRSVDLRSWILTPKVSVNYQTPVVGLSTALNTFYNALVLSSTISSTPTLPQDTHARFLGANLRADYLLPRIEPPFSLSLGAGFYYTAMMVTKNRFGYSGQVGPEILPIFSYRQSDAHRFSIYIKYAAIAGLNLRDAELATGLGWRTYWPGINPLLITIDYAKIGFSVGNYEISSKTLTLSAGYDL